MTKIFDFEQLKKQPLDNESIIIERTDEFMEAERVLGDFIKALPLTAEQNNKLIELMAVHINDAERGGFKHGCDIGVKIGKHKGGFNDELC